MAISTESFRAFLASSVSLQMLNLLVFICIIKLLYSSLNQGEIEEKIAEPYSYKKEDI